MVKRGVDNFYVLSILTTTCRYEEGHEFVATTVATTACRNETPAKMKFGKCPSNQGKQLQHLETIYKFLYMTAFTQFILGRSKVVGPTRFVFKAYK